MKAVQIISLIFCFGGVLSVFGQELNQTVRGTLIDFESKTPIIGAKVIVVNSSPIKGAISNEFGEYRIENVPVGRIELKITAFGFQDMSLPNLLIESGKEKILNLEMQTDIKTLSTMEVSSRTDKSEAINKMATVSAKTFTVEETNRYAGSLNDPSRMVSAFAGVVGNAEGDNDIVVRGNSPKGVLWRLDGIDIPNPNHFSGQGATGGPVNALNGSMLANSDFFSGAFAPEYGNALSGVFDVKFRQGNNEKREYAFSLGATGIDGTLEGPFKKGYRGSYLVNYRYSTISLLDKLGILDFGGIPVYQDLSFKLNFPTQKAGTFSFIGLGGISSIYNTDKDDSTDHIYSAYNFKAKLGVLGLKHLYVFNPKIYISSYLSAMTASNGGKGFATQQDSTQLYNKDIDLFSDNTLKGQVIVNFRPNPKNSFQLGSTYTFLMYNFKYQTRASENFDFEEKIKSKGNSSFNQSFVSWKHRFSNELSLVLGIHTTHFDLNDNFAIEPRFGMKWQQSKRSDFSAGMGLHSRMESVSTYLYNELQSDGSYFYPNRNLDFSKSAHFVLGYGLKLTDNLRFKSEIYYQHLYNTPVANDPNSSFSISNLSAGIPDIQLVNKGTGRNYGIELTLERYFNNNFYFLATTSLYKSQYKTLDGVMRNSRYDGNIAANVLGGKEFKFGKEKNKTFGINTKVSLLGGNRFTPINLEASQLAGEEIYRNEKPYSVKGDAVFVFNLGLTYRVDLKKTSHSFKIDIQNLTNNQAKINEYYNARTAKIENATQLSIIPNVIYTLKF